MDATKTKLVIGLGNPGPRYSRHRHNIGFMVLDRLATELGVAFAGTDPTYVQAVAADASGLVLLKPLTYMNLSGEAALRWSATAGVPLAGGPFAPVEGPEGETEPEPGLRPLVICDDLNLPLGSLRLRSGGRSGGQNGLLSLIDCLGGEFFPRMRLGIAPLEGTVPPASWPDYVLSDFAADEAAAVEDLVDHACGAVRCWLEEGLEGAVSRFNRRIRPAPPSAD